MAKGRPEIEFRYYEMPAGEYVLPKLGRGWEMEYGKGYNGVLHFHNLLEIGYCYHGDGKVIISGQEYRYKKGCFTIIPDNIPHTTVSEPGHICKWEYLFIDLASFVNDQRRDTEMEREALLRELNSSGFFLHENDHPEIASLVRGMMEECRQHSLYYKEVLKGFIQILAAMILRLHRSVFLYDRSTSLGGTYLDQAINYFCSNYKDDIRISDAAAYCGLSESHFRRMFEKSMNMKPLDFLNMIRIREACRMIEKGEASIKTICFRVGYLTPSTFNRNFTRLTGMTPIEWKKEKANTAGFYRNFRISAQKGWEVSEETAEE